MVMAIMEQFGAPPNDAAPWLKDSIQLESVNRIKFSWWDLGSKAKRRALLRSLKRTQEGNFTTKEEAETQGVNSLAYHLVGLLHAQSRVDLAHDKVTNARKSLRAVENKVKRMLRNAGVDERELEV